MDTRLKKRSRRHATGVETKDEVAVETCASLSQFLPNIFPKEIHLNYDVLEILFQLLSYRDLTNAMLVSRSWAEAARKEIQTRYELSNFMIRAYDLSKCMQGSIYEEFPTFTMCKCLKNTKCLSDKLQNLRIDPYISFYFVCDEDICEQMSRALGYHQTRKNSEIILLNNMGLIMDKQDPANMYLNVVCSFLPKIPNTDIRIFKRRMFERVDVMFEYSFAALEEQLMKALEQLSLPNEETSTCFILLINKYRNVDDHVSRLLTNLNRYSSKISSLWGGIVENCTNETNGHENLRPLLYVGILITGRIKTWSTILIDECNREEKIKHLEMWKEKVQLKKHSIAYMFSCCKRGKKLHQDKQDETSIFKSVFPTLRLVGCFGNGEFGKFTFPELKRRKRNRKNCTPSPLMLYTTYSTVFMILTYD